MYFYCILRQIQNYVKKEIKKTGAIGGLIARCPRTIRLRSLKFGNAFIMLLVLLEFIGDGARFHQADGMLICCLIIIKKYIAMSSRQSSGYKKKDKIIINSGCKE